MLFQQIRMFILMLFGREEHAKLKIKTRGEVEDIRLEAEDKKNPRPRPSTALPRTDPLEAKDWNARGQGQGLRTQAQVFFKNKKRSSKFFFRRSPNEENKKGLRKFFARFLAFSNKILTVPKIVLSSSRGQSNFRGHEAMSPRLKPRISKCIPKDVLEAKDVLEDSTSDNDQSRNHLSVT